MTGVPRLAVNEASSITTRVAAILPRNISGKKAILDMKEADVRGWRDLEYFGFWFENIFKTRLLADLGMRAGPQHGHTRFDIAGAFVWDLKVHGMGSKQVILNDREAMEACLKNGPLGFIIVHGDYTKDDADRSFKLWHDREKGKPTAYVLEGVATGRNSRPRKTAFDPVRVQALVLPSADTVKEGMRRGWMTTFQEGMRNAGGSLRRQKYKISSLERVPAEFIVAKADVPRSPG